MAGLLVAVAFWSILAAEALLCAAFHGCDARRPGSRVRRRGRRSARQLLAEATHYTGQPRDKVAQIGHFGQDEQKNHYSQGIRQNNLIGQGGAQHAQEADYQQYMKQYADLYNGDQGAGYQQYKKMYEGTCRLRVLRRCVHSRPGWCLESAWCRPAVHEAIRGYVQEWPGGGLPAAHEALREHLQ